MRGQYPDLRQATNEYDPSLPLLPSRHSSLRVVPSHADTDLIFPDTTLAQGGPRDTE